MNLYLLRHGIAVDSAELDFAGDAARPLTPKGRRQLRNVAAAVRAMKVTFDAMLASPLVRTQQTAEVMAKALKFKSKPGFADELRPGGKAEQVIRKINALKPAPESLLIVGHEPDLSELVSLLVSGDTGGGFSFKKAGLAKLEVEKLSAGKCATLAWLLTPAQMKLME